MKWVAKRKSIKGEITPANLPAEWYAVEEEYRNAKSLDEKIEKLKKLIALTPKHKGTENLLAQLRKKLAQLNKEKQKRKKTTQKSYFKKVGDVLVSIIGLTNSGKSTLLKALTNASVEISEKPYTTKELATGVCKWKGVYIQFVEIPSFFTNKHLSVARESDILIILIKSRSELVELEKILKEKNLWQKKKILIQNFDLGKKLPKAHVERDYSELLDGIIAQADLFRVFLKPKGKPVEETAVVFRKKPTVEEVIKRINRKWLETFKFAKVFFGHSVKRVGLDYELEDGSILEIHA